MTCQPVKSSVTACLVLQLSLTPSWAELTRQGDHVHLSHRDVAMTVHQHTLAFERTYNAQSTHSGWVGTGWVKRPGFRGGSNTGEWSHEEVPEVFA